MRRLQYYEPSFPFPQGAAAGPYPKFLGYYEPSFPFPQGAAAGPYPRLLVSPGMNGLGTLGVPYRPNQGFFRGVTPGVSKTLADGIDLTSLDLTDPTTLLMLVGGGFLLWMLFRTGKKTGRALSGYSKRRARRRAAYAQAALA